MGSAAIEVLPRFLVTVALRVGGLAELEKGCGDGLFLADRRGFTRRPLLGKQALENDVTLVEERQF